MRPCPWPACCGSLVHSLGAYEDVKDAEWLCHGPTCRLVGSERLWDRGAAMASRLHSFKTEMPGKEEIFMSL
jgi:hypothetical protein